MYDLIIIGAGPAGLTASIYASRFRVKNLVIGKELGGTMALATSVENYPAFERISGWELAEKMIRQVKNLGGEVVEELVVQLKSLQTDKGLNFEVVTEKENYKTRAIILALGTKRRELGVPGEKEYLGKGVSYCAACDAAFFKNKKVAVIGGANAAVMSATHLAKFAQKIYLIYRGEALRAEPIWRERAEKNPKIEIMYNTNVKAILGDADRVIGVEIDRSYKGNNQLDLDGVFIEIGGIPGGELAKMIGVELDENNYIKVNPQMETNIPGVFAAGDIANLAGELQQIVVACAEGAIAALSAYKYLEKN